LSLFVLDTSAILAHWLKEPGHQRVTRILASESARISAPTRLELLVRLCALGAPPAEAEAAFERYRLIVGPVLPIDDDAVTKAWELRRASPSRLPAIDALIAGCAASHGATLIHRDPHFDGIPKKKLARERLPG
jgi:predicted nucleic acid-binding protein